MQTSNNANYFSLKKIIASFFCIFFIRVFLENFSSPTNKYFFSWQGAFLHAPLYFFSIFLSFTILLFFFTKYPLRKIIDFILKISLFILVAPLIDLAIYGSRANSMSYASLDSENFVVLFLKLINPFSENGITLGMHVSAYLILFSLSFFVYKKTKKILPSASIFISGYLIFFCYAILPNILTLSVTHEHTSFSLAYIQMLKNSWITTTIENFDSLKIILWQNSYMHDILMAQIYWVMIFLQSLLVFYLANKKIWSAFIANSRIERITTWILIAFLGIAINYKLFGQLDLKNPANLITFLTYLLLIILNIWLAVFINDKEDISIDAISNPSRPLVKNNISLKDWNDLQFIISLLIVFGVATLNRATATLLILAQATYYIYSARPLRLKRHFISSSLLVGLASSLIAMSGFFLVSADQHLKSFPLSVFFIILISFALIFNIKDLKDYEGDKNENIKTLPVVLGLKKSKRLIIFFCYFIFIGIPLLIKLPAATPSSILAAILMHYILTRNNYSDKYAFAVLTLYMFSLIIF